MALVRGVGLDPTRPERILRPADSCLRAGEQHREQRFLDVEPILGLIENALGVILQGFGSDLFTTVGG